MVLGWLRARFCSPCIVELSSSCIRVRDLAKAGAITLECEPLLSVDANDIIVSIGRPVAADVVQT